MIMLGRERRLRRECDDKVKNSFKSNSVYFSDLTSGFAKFRFGLGANLFQELKFECLRKNNAFDYQQDFRENVTDGKLFFICIKLF